jgi:hypothetical protein
LWSAALLVREAAFGFIPAAQMATLLGFGQSVEEDHFAANFNVRHPC